MTFSGLTSGTLPHHNKYASRQGRGITRVIVHHWAGTTGGDTSLASPGRDASANYILYGDGRLVGQVPEEYRAWTSDSWEADSYSITVEVQNSAVGGQWPVSDKAIAKLVELIADVGRRYGWGAVNRDRVRGHREFAATACPGPYLWDRLSSIASQANTLLNSEQTNTSGLPGENGDDMAVEDIYVEFKKKGGQPVKAGQTVNLHINDAKDVSVARGDAKHVSGNLAVQISGGDPYKGAVQITPVVRTVQDGKPDKITSLRAREVVFTGGDTLGEVAVNCALKAGQRLSFRIGGSGHDFVVKSAVFRGMKIT